MPEFGNSFKSARETKNLTLEKIAKETRISARFLRAIEDGAFHTLPGGVYNRGFIRTFAERVGLDPDKAVADYTALTSVVATPELELLETASKRNLERHIVPIAVGGLVVLIVLFYVFAQIPAASGTTSLDTGEEFNTSEATAARARPEPNSTPGAAASTSPTPSVEKTETSARPRRETNGTGNTVGPPTTTTDTASGVAQAPVNGVRIQLQVHDTTWISVRSDEEEVVELELGPGTSRSFAAQDAMDLTIGNAAGLTLYINGEQALDLGGEGRVRVLRITPSNFRRYTGI